MTLNQDKRVETLKNNADFADSGLLFMADISGFTRFVAETEFEFGKKVIQELLLSVLEGDVLDMRASEIEGDAVLFYKLGMPPAVKEIVEQFKRMSTLFYDKLNEFRTQSDKPIELSLKFIVHYGKLSPYSIGGFNKLYGQSVIEIHRLLKNSIDSNHYLLMTEDYLQASNDLRQNCLADFKVCEMYSDIGLMCYTYIPYSLTSTATASRSLV